MEHQSRKMRSMFFSSVAHELRTPLNSIIPIIKMILESPNFNLTAQLRKNLRIVLNSALHLQSVIEDALDMSRIENNKFTILKEMFNVREAVEEVCEIIAFQVESKKLQALVKISDEVPTHVFSDLKRYKQILFNLIGNAVKFTFKGAIKVRVDFECEEGRDTLITKVEDSRLGIQREDLNKLFTFFGKISNTKDINKGGMGLGLTISKMIL